MVMRPAVKNLILFTVILASVVAFSVYRTFFFPNVGVGSGGGVLHIISGAGFDEVVDSLKSGRLIINEKSFRLAAKARKYTEVIRPGRYLIEEGMSNYRLINMLRAGMQEPVRITFNNVRTIHEFAGRIGRQIEADSAVLVQFLEDESNYSSDGFRKETVMAVFIPDTYEVYWNITPRGFYQRMLREYNGFWNDERRARAGARNLTPVEVSIIASIVDDEVAKEDEKPRIAGVYLNRLRTGMPLQACPTIKFALNDFTITRVLNEHMLVDSPYNTYKYRGLPPGPVRFPTISGLDAVLNAEKHEYLYFSAKADFSGYHNFSRTLAEHNRYAAEYHRELNRRGIYR
ncbi:MAG: endolytic transglycosylase MltG [Bacteroidetes bacterium]|nr:endolytic transglycosylase MltG [Bacteroidota bacterium]